MPASKVLKYQEVGENSSELELSLALTEVTHAGFRALPLEMFTIADIFRDAGDAIDHS
jgi:hypothetical protein